MRIGAVATALAAVLTAMSTPPAAATDGLLEHLNADRRAVDEVSIITMTEA